MFLKKISLLMVLLVVLTLAIAPLAQADGGLPPGDDVPADDGGQPDGDNNSTGDTIDLSGKHNLGVVMSDKNATGDDADDSDDGEQGGTTGDPTDGDDDDSTTGQHPVALALSKFFDNATYDDIFQLHLDGNGFGNIAKAYFFSEIIGNKSPAELLDEVHGMGWGRVLKENGLFPGAVGNGHKPNKNESTDETTGSDETISTQSENHGPPAFVAPGRSNKPDKDKSNNGRGSNKDKKPKPQKNKGNKNR